MQASQRGPRCGRRLQKAPWQQQPHKLHLHVKRVRPRHRPRSTASSFGMPVERPCAVRRAGRAVQPLHPRQWAQRQRSQHAPHPAGVPAACTGHWWDPEPAAHTQHCKVVLSMKHLQVSKPSIKLTGFVFPQTNVTLGNGSHVVACLSRWAPVLQLKHSQPCSTGGTELDYSPVKLFNKDSMLKRKIFYQIIKFFFIKQPNISWYFFSIQ